MPQKSNKELCNVSSVMLIRKKILMIGRVLGQKENLKKIIESLNVWKSF